MHLRELQAVLGLGGPCQSSSQGRRADRADGVVHLHSDSDLVSPDGSSIATFSVPALVHQEGRTIVRRYVDDPEAGQLPGKNPTTASRTVWPENLDRPGHRASQPNRVSDTSTEDPASSTSSRSIRRGEFHPPGRSRTPSKSTKRELNCCGKIPSLRRAGLPGSFNLQNNYECPLCLPRRPALGFVVRSQSAPGARPLRVRSPGREGSGGPGAAIRGVRAGPPRSRSAETSSGSAYPSTRRS